MPQDIAEHMRLMCDLLVLAFQTDTTRIATLKLNNDHSAMRFPNLGVDYMIHHLLSHTDGADWLKVNQFFTQQVAYIAGKLDQIQEGERTALDNTMLVFLSSMLHGNHDCNQLPVVIVGKAGGQLQTGRTLDYLDKPNRKMCSMYLSLMEKMGVKLDTLRRFQRAAERDLRRQLAVVVRTPAAHGPAAGNRRRPTHVALSANRWPCRRLLHSAALFRQPGGLFRRHRLAEDDVQDRRQIAGQENRRDHAADHDDGQRTLRLSTDAGRQCRRQQPEDRRQASSS